MLMGRRMGPPGMPTGPIERAQDARGVVLRLWGYLRRHPADNEDLVARLDVPTLFVLGERDGGVPPADAQALAARLADGHVRVVDGVGHTPFVEDAAGFDRSLAEFVAQVDAGSASPR